MRYGSPDITSVDLMIASASPRLADAGVPGVVLGQTVADERL